jgi:hypothetical protein
MAYFGDLSIRVALDFPYRGWGNALDHEKETAKIPILGQVRFRQFVLSVASLCLDDWNTL